VKEALFDRDALEPEPLVRVSEGKARARTNRSPRFFPGIPRTYSEGNLTLHEGLVALSAWKHSFAEERVGFTSQSNDGEFRPMKGESRAQCPALLPISNYYC
jgi:hypothetical protein